MDEVPSFLQISIGSGTAGQNVLGVLLGLGFTAGLFMSIAHFQKATPEDRTPEIEDFRIVALPLEPPPPPRAATAESDQTTLPMAVPGFEAEASDSPVKIAASPPVFDTLVAFSDAPPPAVLRMGQFYGEFKPKADFLYDAQHVFLSSEVDRLPSALYRKYPVVPQWVRKGAESLQVTLIFVVDANGTVGKVRLVRSSGNSDFDDIIVETIKEWAFSPAIKKGKEVKCLVNLPVIVRWPKPSPFGV